MRCGSCTAENPEHAKFCLECGAQLGRRCAACGAELPGSAKFCLECGKPRASASKPGLPPPDPRSYTPKHLAEKILTSRSAVEGERRQVTVCSWTSENRRSSPPSSTRRSGTHH